MDHNKALSDYFQSDQFSEFMKLWKKQVEKYGQMAGKIHLPLTDENRECISAFMGKNYQKQSHAVIYAKQVKKIVKESCFCDADMNIVIPMYFNETLITRKNRKQLFEDEVEETLSSLINDFKGTKAEAWLLHCKIEKNNAYQILCREIKKHRNVLYKACTYVMKALNQLPFWKNEKELLAVFAGEISGDPHFFDAERTERHLLEHGICFFIEESIRPSSMLDRNLLLASVGIHLGEMNNYCMIAHLNAYIENELHPAWTGFYKRYEIWNVNMFNLSHITRIDSDSCKAVIIIENPSVFQSLVHFSLEREMNAFGFICTGGNLNSCGYLLLDMVAQAKIPMYYCGDFDPEGLLIADRLKKRFKTALQLWQYDDNSFVKASSSKYPSGKRLATLKNLENSQLIQIGDLLKSGFALGYQENILPLYQEALIKMHQMYQISQR